MINYEQINEEKIELWLTELNKRHSPLLSDEKLHVAFRQQINDMGQQGLQYCLAYLKNNENRGHLRNLLNCKSIPFYLTVKPSEFEKCIELLFQHIKDKYYFPFTKLGVSYDPKNTETLYHLLERLNQQSTPFKEISLLDVDLQNSSEVADSLQQLIQKAHQEKWIIAVTIPGLEKLSKVKNSHVVQAQYKLLQNVIAANRATVNCTSVQACVTPNSEQSSLSEVFSTAIEQLGKQLQIQDKKGFPLQQNVQLQIQHQVHQQQQVEQKQQVGGQQYQIGQQQQYRMGFGFIGKDVELVDYENIEKVCGGFYQNLQNGELGQRLGDLSQFFGKKRENESPLQAIFRCLTGTDPKHDVPKVIRYMTPEAIEELLSSGIHLLDSGLDPYNLPAYFVLKQCGKDGGWVLDFGPNTPTLKPDPLRLVLNPKDLALITPPAAWKGDGRRFDLEGRYKEPFKSGSKPEKQDYRYFALFAALQPKQNYASEYEKFCKTYPELAEKLKKQEGKIIQYWLVFIQLWCCWGEAGVTSFLEADEKCLMPSEQELAELLFRNLESSVKKWAAQKFARSLPAMGQIYYQFGETGLAEFVSLLHSIFTQVGEAFFASFYNIVLANYQNFVPCMGSEFIAAMQNMVQKLKDNTQLQKLWSKVCEKHWQKTKCDRVDRLWCAFIHFVQDLQLKELSFLEDAFAELEPNNMISIMNFVQGSLNSLKNGSQRLAFFETFSRRQLDLRYSGIPYATREGVTHVDSNLELTEFTYGTPTYVPRLADLAGQTETALRINAKRILATQTNWISQECQTAQQIFGLNDAKLPDSQSLQLRLGLVRCLRHSEGIEALCNAILDLEKYFAPSELAKIAKALGNLPTTERIDFDVFQTMLLEARQGNVDLSALAACLETMDAQAFGRFFQMIQFAQTLKRTAKDSAKISSLIQAVINLHQPENLKFRDLTSDWVNYVYPLAALFKITDGELLYYLANDIQELISKAPAIGQPFIRRLLSIDFKRSKIDFRKYEVRGNFTIDFHILEWQIRGSQLSDCICEMTKDPQNADHLSKVFFENLKIKEIHFTSMHSGELRTLTSDDWSSLSSVLQLFDETVQVYLKQVLGSHLIIPNVEPRATVELMTKFLRQLSQLESQGVSLLSFLNGLQQAKQNTYWTVAYIQDLLATLQPEVSTLSDLTALARVLLAEPLLNARCMDEKPTTLPKVLQEGIQLIVKKAHYTSAQRISLLKLWLKINAANKKNSVELLEQIFEYMGQCISAEQCNSVLQFFANVNEPKEQELQKHFALIEWLFKATNGQASIQKMWFHALSEQPRQTQDRINYIQLLYDKEDSSAKQKFFLQFLAVTVLLTKQQSDAEKEKVKKLLYKLEDFYNANKQKSAVLAGFIAQCENLQRSTSQDIDVRDLLYLLKQCNANLDQSPLPRRGNFGRADHGPLRVMRRLNLSRLLGAATLSKDGKPSPDTNKIKVKTIWIFNLVKRLEAGGVCLEGFDNLPPITSLSLDQLNQAKKTLFEKDDSPWVMAQRLAVLSEILYRTTGESLHMAQWLSIIGKLLIENDKAIVQMDTGEGKTNVARMQLAYWACGNKYVRYLASTTDLAKIHYQDTRKFLSATGINSTVVEPRSEWSAMQCQIQFATPSSIALFHSRHGMQGRQLSAEEEKQYKTAVDEIDLTAVYSKGLNFNLSVITENGNIGSWLYEALNTFYEGLNSSQKSAGDISLPLVQNLGTALNKAAMGHPERGQFLTKAIGEDEYILIIWLQALFVVHNLLQEGVHYIVKPDPENSNVNKIVPLSAVDKSPFFQATFASFVHPLLAIKLQREAFKEGRDVTFVLGGGDSEIVSSQIYGQLGQEKPDWQQQFGTTATASATQQRNEFKAATVWTLPPNRPSRLMVLPPQFLNNDDLIDAKLQKQVKAILKEKQSGLIFCNSNTEVRTLTEKFKKQLPNGNAVFSYTTDSTQSITEIMQKKRQQRKQSGTLLIVGPDATRGYNWEVDAVWVRDPRFDQTTLKQAIGRTGRNGAKGKASAGFYNLLRLQREYDGLVDEAQVLNPYFKLGIQKPEDSKKLLKYVLTLREYVSAWRAQAPELVGWAKSRLSNWAEQQYSYLDAKDRENFQYDIAYYLKQLEKALQTSPEKLLEKKAQVLDQKLRLIVKQLKNRYGKLNPNIELPQSVYTPNPVPWVEPDSLQFPWETATHSSNKDESQAFTQIMVCLAQLPLKPEEAEQVDTVYAKIKLLLEKSVETQQAFLKQMQDCQSLQDFCQLLENSLTGEISNQKDEQKSTQAPQSEMELVLSLFAKTYAASDSDFKKVHALLQELANSQKDLYWLMKILEEWEDQATCSGKNWLALVPFCQVIDKMMQIKPPRIQQFEKLFNKTKDYWNLKQGRYRQALAQIWQQLAKLPQEDATWVLDWVEKIMSLDDEKAWLVALPPLLALGKQKLEQHQDFIDAFIKHKQLDPNGAFNRRRPLYVVFAAYLQNIEPGLLELNELRGLCELEVKVGFVNPQDSKLLNGYADYQQALLSGLQKCGSKEFPFDDKYDFFFWYDRYLSLLLKSASPQQAAWFVQWLNKNSWPLIKRYLLMQSQKADIQSVIYGLGSYRWTPLERDRLMKLAAHVNNRIFNNICTDLQKIVAELNLHSENNQGLLKRLCALQDEKFAIALALAVKHLEVLKNFPHALGVIVEFFEKPTPKPEESKKFTQNLQKSKRDSNSESEKPKQLGELLLSLLKDEEKDDELFPALLAAVLLYQKQEFIEPEFLKNKLNNYKAVVKALKLDGKEELLNQLLKLKLDTFGSAIDVLCKHLGILKEIPGLLEVVLFFFESHDLFFGPKASELLLDLLKDEAEKVNLFPALRAGVMVYANSGKGDFNVAKRIFNNYKNVVKRLELYEENKKELLDRLLKLKFDKFVVAVELLNENLEMLKKYPKLPDGILTFFEKRQDEKSAKQLSEGFLLLAKNDATTEAELAYFCKRYVNCEQKWLDFVSQDEQKNTIFNPQNRFLFDESIDCLQKIGKKENHQKTVEVMQTFYAARRAWDETKEVKTMLEKAETSNLFNFKDAEGRNNRVEFMRALGQNAFVTHKPNDWNDNKKLPLAWSKNQNRELLKACLAEYTQHAQQIVEETKETKHHSRYSKKTDLFKGPRSQLLGLSAELQACAPTQPKKEDEEENNENEKLIEKADTKIKELKEKFKKDIKEYEASWFKSKSRSETFDQLKRDLDNAATHEQLSKAIQTARKTVVQENQTANAASFWCKQDRRRGRLQATLDKMDNQTQRHWAENSTNTFGAAFKVNQEKWETLVQAFIDALQDHQKQCGGSTLEERESKQKWSVTTTAKQFGGWLFFDYNRHRELELDALIQALASLKNLPTQPRQEKNKNEDKNKNWKILKDAQNPNSGVPSHLRLQLFDLVQKGQAWMEYSTPVALKV